VVTPGFLVLVTGAGTTLEYHTDKKGDRFVLCQNGAPVA
jgi:hypothetical protein